MRNRTWIALALGLTLLALAWSLSRSPRGSGGGRAASAEPVEDSAGERAELVRAVAPPGAAGEAARAAREPLSAVQAHDEAAARPAEGVSTAHGRVVDERGAPWDDAVVEVLPLDGQRARDPESWGESGADGRFRLRRLAPGRHALRVSRAFALVPAREIELARGANDLGDLVLPRDADLADVSGELVVPERLEPTAVVVLRDPRDGRELFTFALSLFADRGGDGRVRFVFEDVPAGRYELEVVPLDGFEYAGVPREIEAPAAGLAIEGRRNPRPWRVVARDARSGEELEASLLLQRGPRVLLASCGDDAGLPELTGTSLVLLAEGHVPRRVDSADDAARREGAERVLEVELERGSGCVVVFRDAGAAPPSAWGELGALLAPPLAGVRVLAGGRELARSDAGGLALVGVGRPPAGFAFELEGWRARLVEDDDEALQLVLMTRE